MKDESELERTARLLRQSNVASENAKRLMGHSSSLKAVQDAMDTPVLRMMKELHDSPTMRLIRQLEDNPVMRLQRQVAIDRHKLITEAYDKSVLKKITDINKRHAALLPNMHLASRSLLPASALDDAIKLISLASKTNLVGFSITDRYSSRLKNVMSSMEKPWMSIDTPALSLQGVSVLTALSDTIQHQHPFERLTREFVDHYLGGPIELEDDDDENDADLAHLEAGMDAGLVSLSAPETNEILELSGFSLVLPFAPLPRPINDDGSALFFDPAYFAFINQIEAHLRAYVDKEMSLEFGNSWIKSRISSNMLEIWVNRQEAARKKGEPVFEILQYADLNDLKDIIIGKRTWPALFSAKFGVKEHFMTAMDRLYAVRNPLAHSRPISNGMRLHLDTEGSLILKALGVEFLRR